MMMKVTVQNSSAGRKCTNAAKALPQPKKSMGGGDDLEVIESLQTSKNK
jgi:hypothetical protein